MPTFVYKAKNTEGVEQAGTLVAENRASALKVLNGQGLYPLEIKEQTLSFTVTGRVRLSELVNFYTQLSDLLRAGVPILRSLDVLSRQNPKSKMSRIVRELREDVSGGASLADAMEKHLQVFSPLHIGIIRAGEQGGFLEQVLSRLGIFLNQRDQLRNKVIGSMIYPVFLLVIGVTVVIVLVTYFMPKLEPLFQGMELPALTRGVMGFGKILQGYFWLILFGFVLLMTLVLPYFRSEAGRYKWHKLQLQLPVVGKIFKMVAICRFCRILGTLLGNGVPMINALTIAKSSAGNELLEEVIGEAIEAVRAGKSLADTLRDSGLFPLDIADMISVAEETNRLPDILIEIADTQEQRLSQKIDLAVRMLEPLMLLIVFAMVFVIALALLLPILQMSMGKI